MGRFVEEEGAEGDGGEGPEIELRVRDEGPGIPPERHADVFERFVRLDGSRQRATGGAGLGLAIVKQLVEAHGGRVGLGGSPIGADTSVGPHTYPSSPFSASSSCSTQ